MKWNTFVWYQIYYTKYIRNTRVYRLGRCENVKLWKMYFPQMNYGYTHKNKKEKNSKTHKFLRSCILKNRQPPKKVKKDSEKKSGFMVFNRIGLLPRNQHTQKTEFNPSYYYGATTDNVLKCFVHFGMFLRNAL